MARRGPHKPETLARMRAAACRMVRPDVRERIATRTKEAMADPAVRQRVSDGTRKALADPKTRARHREAVAAAMASPAVRARIRDGMARAKLRAELPPFLAVWAVLSDEARAVALREIGAPQS